MCGFLGMVGSQPVAGELFEGLLTLQHRGQDAAGFCTTDGTFHVVKGGGLVEDVFRPEAAPRLAGRIGIAHVRYPTVGGGSAEDAQPFVVTSPLPLAMAHNGNVTNCAALRRELAEKSRRHVVSGCDVEVILQVLADELAKRPVGGALVEDLFAAVAGVFRRVRGAYTVVTLVGDQGMLAFRDPSGIRPGILGERDGPGGRAVGVASESVALDRLEFHRTRDLVAGEATWIAAGGTVTRRQVAPGRPRPCIFEHVYFARPDSFLDKVSVYKTRLRLGEALAAQVRAAGLDPDVVIPVPDTARPAALSCAAALKIPYREGLQKNRYVARTFIMPGQDRRTASVRRKLNTIQVEFEGKRVLLVDDSLVRGTTSRALIAMAREAGAAKVYLALTAPPIRFPCVYGIDMSTTRELIARDHGIAELTRIVGADALLYQRLEDLVGAAHAGNPDLPGFCTGCFTGEYPTGDVTPDMLAEIERERLDAGAGAGPAAKR